VTDTRLATILISKRSLFLKYLIHIAAIAVDYRRRLEYQAAAMPKVAAKSVFGPDGLSNSEALGPLFGEGLGLAPIGLKRSWV